WDTRVAGGGHMIVPWSAPANYDMMISGIASQPTNNKLFNAGLREGLDLPEVSLVCSLDADKAGFLRSETSLVQIIGRTARNVNAEVKLYADSVTPAMQAAMDETDRRRKRQQEYNETHGITPETIKKAIRSTLEQAVNAHKVAAAAIAASEDELDRTELVAMLESEMLEAASALEFERAAKLRDRIKELKDMPELVTESRSKRDAKKGPKRSRSRSASAGGKSRKRE
ncbi:MAG: UvrB/UvrC motif-containing protein, partial [Planctomycetes bacterium]|nr:UvrB/UvrC motif-containing protein [Planctomycetota bacterium]